MCHKLGGLNAAVRRCIQLYGNNIQQLQTNMQHAKMSLEIFVTQM